MFYFDSSQEPSKHASTQAHTQARNETGRRGRDDDGEDDESYSHPFLRQEKLRGGSAPERKPEDKAEQSRPFAGGHTTGFAFISAWPGTEG